MHSLFLALLCATLCSASSDSLQENIETLMDNVLVLQVPSIEDSKVHVRLTCGDAYKNQPVFWKKNGMDLEQPLQGNQVEVLVEELDGGNYTCHLGPDGDYLNHTMILVQLEPDNKTVILEKKSPEGHIHCSALNYEGSFHCTWTRSQLRSRAPVLLVKAERFNETIPCELDVDGSGVRCQDTNCSHGEEQHSITLTVYFYSVARLESYKKTFYLREIVKPEKVVNLQVSQGNVFRWSYPLTWSKPCSYYPLRFQVNVVPNKDLCTSDQRMVQTMTNETKFEVNVKTKRYVFCVRAQDTYTNGQWSQWSRCILNRGHVDCSQD